MLRQIARKILTPTQRQAIHERLYGPPGRKSPVVSAPVFRYASGHTTPPDRVLAHLAATTRNAPGLNEFMQVPHDEGMLLTILTAAAAPTRVIEVGTFTGYSSLCIARGLPPGGKLLTLDQSEESTKIATKFWLEAGVADRIELRLGLAADLIAALPAEPTFGLAFIDADKVGYQGYWDLLVPRMLPGGLILADNVLLEGAVTRPRVHGDRVDAIRRFNEHVNADPRVEHVLLTVADGLILARVLA
jgi:caffeoyl-CoA O-methyltransferase